MKVRVGVDKFTDLRSKIRQAFERKDDDALEEHAEAFFGYMRERYCAGTLSAAEQRWLAEHPKFEQRLDFHEGDLEGEFWASVWGD